VLQGTTPLSGRKGLRVVGGLIGGLERGEKVRDFASSSLIVKDYFVFHTPLFLQIVESTLPLIRPSIKHIHPSFNFVFLEHYGTRDELSDMNWVVKKLRCYRFIMSQYPPY